MFTRNELQRTWYHRSHISTLKKQEQCIIQYRYLYCEGTERLESPLLEGSLDSSTETQSIQHTRNKYFSPDGLFDGEAFLQ